MKYIEGKIFTSIRGLEYVEALLLDRGIDGVVISDPRDIVDLQVKKQPYDWDYIDESVLALEEEEPSLTFYLNADEEGATLRQDIQIALMKLKNRELYGELLAESEASSVDLGRLYCDWKEVDDTDWKDNWKEYFKPAHITDRLVVKPLWETYVSKPGELVIEIDPGMAFGTGTHATTAGCMKLMEKYLKAGDKVLDVGCGSGILAIAAGLLGAGEVLGVEIDPVAVPIARENVEINGLSQLVKVEEGDLTKGLNYTADLVVANLMADLIIILSPDIPRHLKPDGYYIVSGIILEKKDEVWGALEACGFRIIDEFKDDTWCALAGRYAK